MGNIVNSTYMTIDGDITNVQDWHFEAWNDEAAKAAGEIIGAPEALIMGRLTYDAVLPGLVGAVGRRRPAPTAWTRSAITSCRTR